VSSQIFLLSPAYCAGRRAAILRNAKAASPLALQLRDERLSIGEAFAFLSGLYFRGKLAYACAFGRAPASAPPVLVITPTRGLVPPDAPITPAMFDEFAGVDLGMNEPRFRTPLGRDVARLASSLPQDARVILLGSVATGKYVDILVGPLGRRLHYPLAFIGRGDMSRGGLLLRSARSGAELEYAVLDPTATRRGPRPPRLEPLSRHSTAGSEDPARILVRPEREELA
jgi:hypothetical protein